MHELFDMCRGVGFLDTQVSALTQCYLTDTPDYYYINRYWWEVENGQLYCYMYHLLSLNHYAKRLL